MRDLANANRELATQPLASCVRDMGASTLQKRATRNVPTLICDGEIAAPHESAVYKEHAP